jgi:hypothetical protein
MKSGATPPVLWQLASPPGRINLLPSPPAARLLLDPNHPGLEVRHALPLRHPPKNLDPITHAGSAWAVLGLVRSSPGIARPGSAPVQ